MKLVEKVNPGMVLNFALDLIKEKEKMVIDNKELVETDVWFGENTIIILTFEDATRRIELYLRDDELILDFNNDNNSLFNYKLFIELVNKVRSYEAWINN